MPADLWGEICKLDCRKHFSLINSFCFISHLKDMKGTTELSRIKRSRKEFHISNCFVLATCCIGLLWNINCIHAEQNRIYLESTAHNGEFNLHGTTLKTMGLVLRVAEALLWFSCQAKGP